MKVILGSSSLRRRSILSLIFPGFELLIPDIDERTTRTESPEDFACRMSKEKMNAILERLLHCKEPLLAVTADTIVALNERIIGKPADYKEAVEILSALSGKTHQVITGMTLFAKEPGKEGKGLSDFAKSSVTFNSLTAERIREYLAVTDWHDKAGAYSVQNGSMIIGHTEGSVSNIVGFPVSLFLKMTLKLNRAILTALCRNPRFALH